MIHHCGYEGECPFEDRELLLMLIVKLNKNNLNKRLTIV